MPLSPVDTSSGYAPSVDSAADGTATLINWWPVRSRADGPITNVPRPALSTFGTSGLDGQNVVGLYVFQQNYLIAVTALGRVFYAEQAVPSAFYEITTASVTLTATKRPTFAEDGSTLFIVAGGQMLRWEPGGAPSIITAAPDYSTHVATLSQRVVANSTVPNADRDLFYWSDIGDALDTTWPALNYQNAEARPDAVVALYENTSELFVFGESTLQVYGITEDPNSPFGAANTVNVGCGAPYSPTRVDDSFIFIDDSRRLVRSDGRTIEDIGQTIQSDIRSFETVADAWCWRERFGRWEAIGVRFPTAQRTYRLDLSTGTWSEVRHYNPSTGLQEDFPVNCYVYWPAADRHLFGASSGGGVLELTSSAVVDHDGEPILCERETGYHDHGTSNWKRGGRILVTMKRGTGGPSGTTDVLEVSVRDDGGAWSDWFQLNIGGDGQSEPVQEVWCGGVFRRRKYRFRYAGSSSTSLVSVFDDVDEVGGA